jgi:SPP1 family predicted phage head-tail adaptor
LNPGTLKHRITIQQSTEASNTYGEMVPTWATFATRRAGIKTMRGSESHKSQQVLSEAKILFSMRYLSGVTTKMRISFDSRLFDILFVDNSAETGKTTFLECEEQT